MPNMDDLVSINTISVYSYIWIMFKKYLFHENSFITCVAL